MAITELLIKLLLFLDNPEQVVSLCNIFIYVIEITEKHFTPPVKLIEAGILNVFTIDSVKFEN